MALSRRRPRTSRPATRTSRPRRTSSQATALKIEQEVEAFRVRKDTLAARHTAAAARAEINSATRGINSSVSDVGQAVESAERRTRELEATADAVDELVAEGVVSKAGESADDASAPPVRRRAGQRRGRPAARADLHSQEGRRWHGRDSKVTAD